MKKILKSSLLGRQIIKFYRKYILTYRAGIKEKEELRNLKEKISNGNFLDHLGAERKIWWQKRINLVISAPENDVLPRNENAGKLVNGMVIMHNGIKVHPLSYYGLPNLKMLIENKGVHEPQEELVFQEVLKEMPTGATMIEMGSFWSFYSMWFHKEVENASNYMIEPDMLNLRHGKRNFSINNYKGQFFNYFVGEKSGVGSNGEDFISVDDFVFENKIKFVDILHSDIQGAELDMLKGAVKLIQDKKVGYIFISTHSNELHYECEQFLKKYNFITVSSADLKETYSYDGILVMKAPYYKGVDLVEITKATPR